MRCSSCQTVIKPVVAIDIDGTLGSYHEHFQRFAELWLGTEQMMTTYGGGEPYREWFCRAFGVDISTFRTIKLAYRQGGMKRCMPIYPDAPRLVNGLLDDNQAEVWLTTTRPHDRYDRVDPDTREWLRRNGLHPDGLLFDADKYGVLADRVGSDRVVFVLDDLSEALSRAREALPRASCWLRETRFNEETAWMKRTDLQHALALARSEVDWWIKRNGEH